MITHQTIYYATCDVCARAFDKVGYELSQQVNHLKERGWFVDGERKKCVCDSCLKTYRNMLPVLDLIDQHVADVQLAEEGGIVFLPH